MTKTTPGSADEAYRAKRALVLGQIELLKRMLTIHDRLESARPRDWGFAGDLGRISELLAETIPSFEDRRCQWKHPTTCGEYASVCMPDGTLSCWKHAPGGGYDPTECLDLRTGFSVDDDEATTTPFRATI